MNYQHGFCGHQRCVCAQEDQLKAGSVTSADAGSCGDISVGGTLPLELALTALLGGVSWIRGGMKLKCYLFFQILELVLQRRLPLRFLLGGKCIFFSHILAFLKVHLSSHS